MGWISLSSQKDTEPEPLENRMQIPDADLDRVAYWGAQTYFPQGVFVPGVVGRPGQPAVAYQPAVEPTYDADGNMTDPGQPEVMAQDAVEEIVEIAPSYRAPTGDEVFKAITDAIYAQIRRDVEAMYLRDAEAQARASVAPIVLTPAD